MSETVLTSPIILDATGQDMLTKLDSIISAINPVAQGVSYDNAGTGMVANNVQSAITELKTGLDNTNSSLAHLIKFETTSTVETEFQSTNAKSVTHTVPTVAGYTPVCVVGYEISGTNTTSLSVYGVWLISTGARLRIKNPTTSTITATTQCRVMYIRTAYA